MSLGHRWSKHQTLHLWLVARETVIIILFPKNLNVYAVGNIEIRHNGGRQSTFAGNSALLPSDVMDFAILPAKRFWRETVWLLDVMWPWGYQWERALMGKIGDLKIQRRDGNENVAFKRL